MGAIRCHGNQSSNPIWPKTLMQPFPHPNDASEKNLVAISPLVSEILVFKSVNAQTDGRRLDWYTISSGELKMCVCVGGGGRGTI